MIASGERMIVNLMEPLPVHVAHLTAWVNKDGTVALSERRLTAATRSSPKPCSVRAHKAG